MPPRSASPRREERSSAVDLLGGLSRITGGGGTLETDIP